MGHLNGSLKDCERDLTKAPKLFMCYTRCQMGSYTCSMVVDTSTPIKCCMFEFRERLAITHNTASEVVYFVVATHGAEDHITIEGSILFVR